MGGLSRTVSRLMALLLTTSLAGCYSKITAYDGNFTIGYLSPAPQLENFVKPIAPGARLDLAVFANGTSEKLRLVEASSSKPGVLRVVSVAGETLTVAGVAPGVTELTITANDPSGKRVTDTMFFHVARPTSHAIEHLCTDASRAAYVRGTEVGVFHHLATADQRAVIGYDYVPLTISPKPALEFVAQPQAATFYRYRATRSGTVTIRSDIDGKAIEARLVEPQEVTKARVLGRERMIAGTTAYAVAVTELPDGTTLCSQNALTRARSLTPKICRVTARLDDSLDDTNREQLAEVTAVEYGTCELEMTLPELGEHGLVLRQSIPVGRVEYPGGGRWWTSVPTWPFWALLAVGQLVGLAVFVRRVRSGRAAR